jgi:Flp pilus assembly protein TadG
VRSWRRRTDEGSATAETVIVVPLAFVVLMIVVQFGVWAHATHIAHATATTGLAVARADGETAETAHEEAAGLLANLGGNSLLQDPVIVASRDAAQASVRVEGTAAAVVPGLQLPVRVEVSGPVDRFVEGG